MRIKVCAIAFLVCMLASSLMSIRMGMTLPQNGIISFPGTRIIPAIDGVIGDAEWADATAVDVNSGNLTGWMSLKCDSQFIYLLIESINDTTPPVTYPRENVWVAIDSLDDGGTSPRTDDLLFNSEFSWANCIWRGTGSGWTPNAPPQGYYAVQIFSGSSHCNSTHLANEIRIPLSVLGNSTHCGFYVNICDSNLKRNIEWPLAGGTWDWWPPSTGTFPEPDLWGTIEFPIEPVAIMNYSPHDPLVSESITFRGDPSFDVFGSITDYGWDFGDGANASGAVVSHAYPSAGTYSVTLTVLDKEGLSNSVVEELTVYSTRPNVPPMANLTWSPLIPERGENVIFDGSSSYDADGWIISYQWSFGDGTGSTGPIVSHSFYADGSYMVSLTVADNSGASTTHAVPCTVLTDWSSDIRLTQDSAHDRSPSIVQTAEGTMLIVWCSERTGDSELYYKMSSDDGGTWTGDMRLTNNPGSEDVQPSIMQELDGTIWVVWASNRLGTYSIYSKTSEDNGISWSNDTRLTSWADEDQDPTIMQASDGTIWVAWSGARDGNIDLYYKTSSDSGATWEDDKRLTTDTAADLSPSIMHASDGTIWVVWSTTRDGDLNIYYKTSEDYGLSWSDDTPLIQDIDSDNTPSILETSDGNIWVVWASNRWDLEEDMLFYKTSSDDGATWTNDTRITFVTGPNRIDRNPSAMETANGVLWVTWASDRIPSGIGPWGQFEIYYKTKVICSQSTTGRDLIAAPLSVTPHIDGNWASGEWDDAFQYNITGPGGVGFMRVKFNNNRLFIMVDSVWDPTLKGKYGSYEGTYVAFDTAHNHGLTPQTDDYLFFCAFSTWMISWKGDGTKWTPLASTGFVGEQALGTSPNSATPHRIDEMSIPLTYVGSVGSTAGFYVIVRDDSSWNGTTYTSWVEWPSSAGGKPAGYPMPPGYIDPCAVPDRWGALKLSACAPDVSVISVMPSASSVYVGQIVNTTVIVKNEGEETETFSVTCNFEFDNVEHVLGTQIVNKLAPNATVALIFIWTTTHAAICILRAEATVLLGEIDVIDNVMMSPALVKVKLLGDINGDYRVDIMDLAVAGLAFGACLDSQRWNPEADISNDNQIDMLDLVLIAKHFGSIP